MPRSPKPSKEAPELPPEAPPELEISDTFSTAYEDYAEVIIEDDTVVVEVELDLDNMVAMDGPDA